MRTGYFQSFVEFLDSATSALALEFVLAGVLAAILLTASMRALQKISSPLVEALRSTRNLLVPTAVVLYLLIFVVKLPYDSELIKSFRTLLWIEGIWVSLALVKALFFSKASKTTWRSRVPGLLIDLLRFAMIIVGTALVIASVWNKDLGGFLATLGIGSIVIGLALQDTLGSLMSGIALLLERPFTDGDWIKVGDITGRVVELNWRSVRLLTRENTMVVVPNSLLAKERLSNFSKPSRVHGLAREVAFSYEDPPNKVRKVLLETTLSTPEILPRPEPQVRTKAYQDSSILYEIRFFITNFERLPEIESDFMTRIWYASRRYGLTIPFPIRTVYKTELPRKAEADESTSIRNLLRSLPLFQELDEDELIQLAADAVRQHFAKGETIVSQGEAGDALYVIQDGKAAVYIEDESHARQEVARLAEGEFFGEMSLLSGEPRSATVVVVDDAEVLVVSKQALAPLLQSRPELAQQLADLVHQRQLSLSAVAESLSHENTPHGSAERKRVILGAIKDFFKV